LAYGSSRRPHQLSLRLVQQQQAQRSSRLLAASSSFHSTALTNNKVDYAYYERHVTASSSNNSSSSKTTNKKASIYDVHRQKPRVAPAARRVAPPKSKDRRDWDHGDWRRYRLLNGRAGPTSKQLAEEEEDYDYLDDYDDEEEERNPKRRYQQQAAKQPKGPPPQLQKDEVGRRFRQSPPTTPIASSSSSWSNRNRARGSAVVVPRNGEVDSERAQLDFRRKSQMLAQRRQQQQEQQDQSGGGGELFSKYARPPQQPKRRSQHQQPGYLHPPPPGERSNARSQQKQEERLRAEQLILQSTPIIMPDDDEDDEEYYEEEERNEKDNLNEPQASTSDPSQFPPHKISAYIACHKGLEPFMKQELELLGIPHTMHKNYGAHLLHKPTAEDLMRCHLYLGTASHVFLRCGEAFSARALGELRRKVQAMPWKNILDLKGGRRQPPKFKVKVSSAKSRLLHSTAIRDQMLSGIYASLGFAELAEKQKDHTKSKSEKEKDMGFGEGDDDGDEDAVRLTIHFYRDKAQIAIDTSATPLHRRGYRLETCKAPLREDLTFALLMSAGWQPAYTISSRLHSSSQRPKYTSFIDPFCGSGTLAIEAASMASGLPPGRLRPAPLGGTKLYDKKKWESLVVEAMSHSAALDSANLKICASDRDKGAVRATQSNAERAGVRDLIETQDCAFSRHPWLENPVNAPDNLLIAANLPFGRRLKTVHNKKRNNKNNPALPMYQRVATHCNSFAETGKNVGAIFLTDAPDLFKAVNDGAQKLNTAISTKHGGIPVAGVLIKPQKMEKRVKAAKKAIDHSGSMKDKEKKDERLVESEESKEKESATKTIDHSESTKEKEKDESSVESEKGKEKDERLVS